MENRLKKKSVVSVAIAGIAVLSLAAVAVAGPGGNGNGNGKGKNKPGPTTTIEQPPPASSSANESDANFVRMMIPHHHQALVLSRFAPDRSTNPELLAFAARIDAEQTIEIGAMQQWQEFYGFDVTDPVPAYDMMMQNPEMVEMMGMATQAELDQLEALTGSAFDQLFLQLMIDHHQGAVDMVVVLMTDGQEPVLQSIGNEMLTTQSTQIFQMQEMLTDIG